MPCFSPFRFPIRLLFVFLCAIPSFGVLAQSPPAPVLAAKSWILVEYATGQVLASNAPDSRVEPASLTKLMTAYLAFSALKTKKVTENQMVTVSTAAWRQEGSRMFIEPRKPVSVGELIRGVIVHSGNDASVALAELLGGDEKGFAQMMNREARRLGMKNSHFINSTGHSHPEHFSTARDLAVLAGAIVRDFPEYYSLYSLKSFTYNRITQQNRNRLLYIDPTVDGMKTGQTKEAGFCQVSSALRGSRRLISVILGASSDSARAQESLKLLNYGFQSHNMMRIYAANQPLSQFRVWKGVEKQVDAGLMQDFIMSMPKGKPNKIEPVLESRQPVLAPLLKGQEIGTLRLTVDGEHYGDFPVVALTDVPQAGFFGRLQDVIMLWFKSL
ncbi:MAG: D-alanyl-D-alanine carboxypeptidase [Betaproteobacteria bacterium]|nr:D-alanyl-D-alanine carboxypeptidase [Betaproteobacteria bacterium]